MGIPQIVFLVLMALALGVSMANDGKVEMKQESWVKTLVSIVIECAILYWGGFFS